MLAASASPPECVPLMLIVGCLCALRSTWHQRGTLPGQSSVLFRLHPWPRCNTLRRCELMRSLRLPASPSKDSRRAPPPSVAPRARAVRPLRPVAPLAVISVAEAHVRRPPWLSLTRSIRAGGLFKLELFLPEEYPMAPPKVCARVHRFMHARSRGGTARVTLPLMPAAD